jgi:hypothetical protein
MANGQFEKGRAKTGGRLPGVANRKTREQQDRIDQFFNHTWDEFINEVWPNLTPRDKKDTIVALMNYRYPKLSSIDVRQNIKQDDGVLGMLAAHVGDAALVKGK